MLQLEPLGIFGKIALICLATICLLASFKIVDLVVRFFSSRWTKQAVRNVLGPLSKFFKGLIAIALVFVVLGALGIDVTPFLLGWGLLGFAIVLALQPVLTDVFSGFSLLISGSIKVGDRIVLPSGEVCKVVEIKAQNTLLYDLVERRYVVISNTDLLKQKVILLPAKLKVTIPLSVNSKHAQLANKVCLRVAKSLKEVEEPKVHTLSLDEKVRLELEFLITEPERKQEVVDAVCNQLLREFVKAGIRLS